MTNRKKSGPRRLRIRSIRRDPVDIPKLGRALIELAQAQAEKEAEAEHQRKVENHGSAKQPPKKKAAGG